MLNRHIAERIALQMPFTPTADQAESIVGISHFLADEDPRTCYILRGYAGTGKTTLVGALVRTLQSLGKMPVLIAPTGRAAKVFGLYAQAAARTIHRTIYQRKKFDGSNAFFSLRHNMLRNTLFIVDEASMIANDSFNGAAFGTGRLLDDLIEHVYNGQDCRLMLVGDTAQLPPVGEHQSPALRSEVIRSYGLSTYEWDLREVVRQAQDSGILHNATALRNQLLAENHRKPALLVKPFDDITTVSGSELIDTLHHCYGQSGVTETIVVTRSNKRANIYNNGIRLRIFDREGELERGDLLMVAKNNYYWAEEAAKVLPQEERPPFSFIANGELAVVEYIQRRTDLYGFRFADVTLRFPDYDDYELDVRILLDALQAEAPALTRAESERLFAEVMADYDDVPYKRERLKKVRENPYFNALQVKYAYAVTCHKAQGGQWQHVFVDQGFLPEEYIDADYLRWLYTAITRSTRQLYLVNWPEEQLQQSNNT